MSMLRVSIEFAKIHLENLFDLALAGEEVILFNDKGQMVRLVPVAGALARR